MQKTQSIRLIVKLFGSRAVDIWRAGFCRNCLVNMAWYLGTCNEVVPALHNSLQCCVCITDYFPPLFSLSGISSFISDFRFVILLQFFLLRVGNLQFIVLFLGVQVFCFVVAISGVDLVFVGIYLYLGTTSPPDTSLGKFVHP